MLTLLPVTALATTGDTLEVGGSSTYALTQEGLNAAISAASTGDTIKFISGGTITLAADISISKSITLDLNGQTIGFNSSAGFKYLTIPDEFSVIVKGPGTITTNTCIWVTNSAALTVEGGAVIEGTGVWQPMINYGTVSMTDGALRQTNGYYVLQNYGAATFNNVTIETSCGSGSVIWAANGTVTLNNCTTRNNFSGTMTGTNPSVILLSNSAALTIDGGSVTAPAGSTLPAIEASSGATFTNNGATITNGYVNFTGKISVTTGNTTTSYANHADGWNVAVNAGSATVKLLADWMAKVDGDSTSFGTGTGFGTGTLSDKGAIIVPSGKTIILDLNGKTIDRALTQSAEYGNVITVQGGLTIMDSSSAAVASQGTITGGYNKTSSDKSGGGILLLGAGSALTLESGNIVGNKSIGWGGGVKNESGTFTMTGGKISGNVANYSGDSTSGFNNCGGGVYVGGYFTMTGGEISGNFVCGSGDFRKGGGVFFYGTVTVGGNAVIQNNKSGCTYSATDGTVSGGITDNVYLKSGGLSDDLIVCSTVSLLAPGASIGVTTQTDPGIYPVTITDESGEGQTNYFHSDSGYGVITKAGTGLQLSVTIPGAPTIGTATAGDGQATVSFTPPASNGGAAIIDYTVTSSPGGLTAKGSGSPITVTGLTNGVAYTFTVTATNAAGTSPASAASNSVAPGVPAMTVSALTAFISQIAGYASAPAAQTVTITNTGNQAITLTQPTATNYEIGALSTTDLAVGGTATFTVRPKIGLAVGTYNETINIMGLSSASTSVSVSVSAQFTVTAAPPASSSGGGSTRPTPVTKIDNGGSTTSSNIGQLVSGGKTLTVEGTNGAKLVFHPEALKGIDGQISGGIKVEIKDVSPAHQENLPGKQVFSLSVSSGGSNISNFGGAVTVSLPYELKNGETADKVSAWYLANGGIMTEIPCNYDPVTKLATFTVTHFSLYVVGVGIPWVNPFTDVKESDWFYSAVEFANRNGLFAGTGTGTFSPIRPMTRAMLWTVLGRLDGQSLSGSGAFDAARSWAMGAGITDGTNPDGCITWEQMVTILWRYAGSPKTGGDLSKFYDAGSVASYAVDAMAWAVENGMIAGANGALMPQGNATRAQVAAVLQSFIEATAK